MASRLYVIVVSAALAVAIGAGDGAETMSTPARPTPNATEAAQLSIVAAPAGATPIATEPPKSGIVGQGEPEDLLRIYDFSPVSEANPVVARVADTPIAIPMSELRAYLKAEVSDEERKKLDPSAKKKHLERLVDELVLLRDAYRQNVDASERITRALEGTRRMLLTEFLTREEVGNKANSAQHYASLQAALEDRLFEKAEIIVSNEGYAALKGAVAQYGSRKPEELPADLAAHPLAECGDMKIAVGDVFTMYVGLPGKRPDITAPEALSGLLKELLADGLKVAEARARGIDKSRSYREVVAANRAALTRMWLRDRITDKAVQRMKAPETAAHLRQWYDDNLKTHYTYKDEKGVEKVIGFDTENPSIRNDYFDILRERVRAERAGRLREGLKVEIDERLVAGA